VSPTVSVLMSVYNGQRFLREAVESILSQTHEDLEFIVVDDGSTDATPVILGTYTDPRIVKVRNNQNRGLTPSLNLGLNAARGEFIARMDADDISLPRRLECQVKYMKEHPDVGVLGTNIVFIDENGMPLHAGRPLHHRPISSAYLRWLLLWQNPLPHPSVMMRAALVGEGGMTYDSTFVTSQDYDLWTRLSHRAGLALLQEVCLRYRVASTSITREDPERQLSTYYFVMRRELMGLMGDDVAERTTQTLFDMVVRNREPKTPLLFRQAVVLLLEAYRRFLGGRFSEAEREEICADVVRRVIALPRISGRDTRKARLFSLWQLLKLALRGSPSNGRIFMRAVVRVSANYLGLAQD
jgi:hypothetical protein